MLQPYTTRERVVIPPLSGTREYFELSNYDGAVGKTEGDDEAWRQGEEQKRWDRRKVAGCEDAHTAAVAS